MNCQCGGVIRQQGVPFHDILRSCTCASPVAIQTGTIITTSSTNMPHINHKKED